jgi:ADP-heptose:LPS heptosyltransferase
MGDLVCADIALQELGRDARDFTWLIEKRSRPWAHYRELPFLCYDEQPAKVLRDIWRSYALVINTEQLFGLAQACALSARARNGRLACFETTRGARRADLIVPYDWRDIHETLAFANLFAGALGMPAPPRNRAPRERHFPAQLPPIVLVSGRQSPSRALTLERWLSLVRAWHRGRTFLVAASPEDAAFADEIERRSDGLATRFHGNFAELCETISRTEECLTMDGGPVHIASFFGVPGLVVFSSGRSRKWAPLGLGSRVLRRHDLPCQPCTKFGQVPPCPYQYKCLEIPESLGEALPAPETKAAARL